MRKVGIIAIGIIIFLAGAVVEASYYQGQIAQAGVATGAYTADLRTVSSDYQQMYSLCEEKYQAAGKGDLSTAYQLKGQMDALQVEINRINAKYQTAAE